MLMAHKLIPLGALVSMSAKLKFRHIEGFRAVLQTGTATGAASLLNVTQPAVSQLMSEMEAVAGFPLFDRRGGRLVPTPLALTLYEEVERCYTGLDHLNAFCSRLGRSQAKSVVIAAVPSLALSIIPSAIARYIKEVRNDYFTLMPRHSNDALQLVGSQKVDLGFGPQRVSAPGIRCETVSEFEAICVLPLGHALAGRECVYARDLNGLPFIAMSRSEGFYELVGGAFEQEGVEITPVAESPMAAAACALVQNGVGVTLVGQGTAAAFLDKPVVFKRFRPRIPFTFYAYWLELSEPPSWRGKFIDIVKSESKKINEVLTEHLGRVDLVD
jgi:DNA-binding transcriptional LysR family regulator